MFWSRGTQRRLCKVASASRNVQGVEDFCDGSQRMIRQLGITQTSFGMFPKNNMTQRIRCQILRGQLRLLHRSWAISWFLAPWSSKATNCKYVAVASVDQNRTWHGGGYVWTSNPNGKHFCSYHHPCFCPNSFP